MNINGIDNLNMIKIDKVNQAIDLNPNKEVENKVSFEEYLKNSLADVNKMQIESERQTTLLATGQAENVHDVTIAAAKAKISLDLTMAVRNKVVEAYKEIMRMQV